MKRLQYLVFIVIGIVVLFSCKKEYSYEGGPVITNPYYISATINGKDTSFVYNTLATYTTALSYNVLELSAFASKNTSDNTSLTLDIFYDAATVPPPGAGTYSMQTGDYFVGGVYDYNDPNLVYATTPPTGTINLQPLTITVSSITNKIATGTFSGNFYLTNKGSGLAQSTYITINNGKFRLPIP